MQTDNQEAGAIQDEEGAHNDAQLGEYITVNNTNGDSFSLDAGFDDDTTIVVLNSTFTLRTYPELYA